MDGIWRLWPRCRQVSLKSGVSVFVPRNTICLLTSIIVVAHLVLIPRTNVSEKTTPLSSTWMSLNFFSPQSKRSIDNFISLTARAALPIERIINDAINMARTVVDIAGRTLSQPLRGFARRFWISEVIKAISCPGRPVQASYFCASKRTRTQELLWVTRKSIEKRTGLDHCTR